MAKPLFTSLPEELQSAIISHISRPKDLNNVTLTCRRLKEIALPFLYRTVTYTLGEACGLLRQNHPGHQYITHLEILPDMQNIGSEHRNHTIQRILQVLPENSLEGIKTSAELPLAAETVAALCSRQQRLKYLAFRPKSDMLLLDEAHPSQWLTELQTLHIFNTESELQGGTVLLEYYENIILNCENLRSIKDDNNHAFMRTLASMLEFTTWKHRKLQLMEIQFDSRIVGYTGASPLDFVNFVGNMFSQAIDFSCLRYLSIQNCDRTPLWLEYFTQVMQRSNMRLRRFSCNGSGTSYGTNEGFRDGLRNFLNGFSGLEYFQFREGIYIDFDLAVLDGHSATLKHVLVDIDGYNSAMRATTRWRSDMEVIRRFLARTPQLQQVGLALPDVRVAAVSENDLGPFGDYLDCISELPSLRILRILSWPQSSEAMTSEAEEKKYFVDLDNFASLVVRRLKRNRDPGNGLKLKILTFGNSFYRNFSSPKEGPNGPAACYIVASSCNSDGVVRYFAKPVKFHAVHSEEPLWDCEADANGKDTGLALDGVKPLE